MPVRYEIINNEQLMHFEIHQGEQIAFMEYRYNNNDIAFMHTEVPANMEGKGIASALAAYAFTYAKENKRPVKIYCPFVMAYLKKHPELQGQLSVGKKA